MKITITANGQHVASFTPGELMARLFDKRDYVSSAQLDGRQPNAPDVIFSLEVTNGQSVQFAQVPWWAVRS